MLFPLAIHKEKNSCYGVTVPDLTGCFSAGDSLDEAVTNASEAIKGHLELLIEDGFAIQEPKPIETHKRKAEFKSAIWMLVSVDLTTISGRAKRINITLPEKLLTAIDDSAKKHGETRSGFIARASMEALAK